MPLSCRLARAGEDCGGGRDLKMRRRDWETERVRKGGREEQFRAKYIASTDTARVLLLRLALELAQRKEEYYTE